LENKGTSKSKSKSFIRYGSNACWIHTITIKCKYILENKNIKLKFKVHQD